MPNQFTYTNDLSLTFKFVVSVRKIVSCEYLIIVTSESQYNDFNLWINIFTGPPSFLVHPNKTQCQEQNKGYKYF